MSHKLYNPDLGIFLVRVGLALVFILHGWAKLADMEATGAFFASLGFSLTFAYILALVEFLGGIAVLLGVFTHWAGILLAGIAFFAIVLVKGPSGFLGGYEFELVLLLSALGVALAGPGSYSLKIGSRR